MTASDLRIIADELDRRNAAWDAQVQAYFDDGEDSFYEPWEIPK